MLQPPLRSLLLLLIVCTRKGLVQQSSFKKKNPLPVPNSFLIFLLLLFQREEHKVKRKDHPKCYICTLNDEETNITIYVNKKSVRLQGSSICSFNVLASGLFPLPLVFSSSPDFFCVVSNVDDVF